MDPLHSDPLPAESYIDLTSDASQPSSFQEALFSNEQQQVTIESKAPVTEKETHDTNKDTCPEDDILTAVLNEYFKEMEVEHTIDLFTIEQEQVNDLNGEIEQEQSLEEDNEELCDELDDASEREIEIVDDPNDELLDIETTSYTIHHTANIVEEREKEVMDDSDDELIDIEAISEEDESDIDELDDSSEDEGPNVEMESEGSHQDNSPVHSEEKEVDQSELTEKDDVPVEKQLQSVSPQQEELSLNHTTEIDALEEDVEQFPSINIDLLNELIEEEEEEESGPAPIGSEKEQLDAVSSEPIITTTTEEKANDTVDSSDDDDNDIFYDVEYEDIDENGNLSNSQTKQNKTSPEGSLDPFKESAINESQIIEAYQALEADPLETDVRDTLVKEAVHPIDLSTTQTEEDEDVEENQVEFEDAPEVLADVQVTDGEDRSPEIVNENKADQLVAQTEEGVLNDDIMEDVEMEEVEEEDENNFGLPAVQEPSNVLDISKRDVFSSEKETDLSDVENLQPSKEQEAELDARHAPMQEIEENGTIGDTRNWHDMEEDTNASEEEFHGIWNIGEAIKRISETREADTSSQKDLSEEDIRLILQTYEMTEADTSPDTSTHEKETESTMVDVEDELPSVGSDFESGKELEIELEDEEELSFTLPESLPIPHENTQIIKEHWRDEELKLESTFEPSRFAERSKHAAELKDVITADKSLTMWWYDALDENKKTIFLFGKVGYK